MARHSPSADLDVYEPLGSQTLHDAIDEGLRQRSEQDHQFDEHRRGRPRSALADRAIFLAVIDRLREVGYDGLTVEAIAARAGVGKATIYRRWRSKGDIVLDLLDTLAASTPAPDTGETRRDLVLFVQHVLDAITSDEYGSLLPGLAAELSRNADLAEVFRQRFLHPRRAVARAVLERGIARGDIRPDIDFELTLDLALAPLYFRRLFSGAPLTPAFAESIVDSVLVGIRPALP